MKCCTQGHGSSLFGYSWCRRHVGDLDPIEPSRKARRASLETGGLGCWVSGQEVGHKRSSPSGTARHFQWIEGLAVEDWTKD